MKPILIDMNEMSDSTEVYESRPHPFFVIFIYLILAILIVTILWMYFSDMDIVVKSNGVFQTNEEVVMVTNSISGKVTGCNNLKGKKVEIGDVLYTIEHEELDKELSSYQEELINIEARIAIQEAYLKALDSDETDFEALKENKYYAEFKERKSLLDLNINSTEINYQNQEKQYGQNIGSINSSINYYETQKSDLDILLQSIESRVNYFSNKDVYYYSLVESYTSSYTMLENQYDTQIKQLEDDKIKAKESQTQSYDAQIKQLETEKVTADESQAQSYDAQIKQLEEEKIAAVDLQAKSYDAQIIKYQQDKEVALYNLKLEQIAVVEQQVQSADNNLLSLEGNLASATGELDSITNGTTSITKDSTILTEKNSIYAENMSYISKQNEYLSNIKTLEANIEKCTIKAESTGYISMNKELSLGDYISAGTEICSIIPQNESGYNAEIYVSNQDIGKLEEGQKVKFEIAAFPSSEYGYVTGTIANISEDIKVDSNSGNTFYLIQVNVDEQLVANDKGDYISLKQGMTCEAKVIIGKKNVLSYMLEKIDLID